MLEACGRTKLLRKHGLQQRKNEEKQGGIKSVKLIWLSNSKIEMTWRLATKRRIRESIN